MTAAWEEIGLDDKIWQAVEQTHPNQLDDWVYNCCVEPPSDTDPFITDYARTLDKGTAIRVARSEILKTLSSKDNQTDGQINFILRLIRDDKYAYCHSRRDGKTQHIPKVQLALTFLRAMKQLPECESFIKVTLNIALKKQPK